MTSYKHAAGAILTAITALAAGCDNGADPQNEQTLINYTDPLAVVGASDNAQERGMPAGSSDQRQIIASSRRSPDAPAAVLPDPIPTNVRNTTAADRADWSIVLTTLTMDGHETVAQSAAERLRALFPRAADMRVHSDHRGSMLIYGRYQSPDDEQAQQDLRELKGLTRDNVRPFARAMLSRIASTQFTARPSHRFDLMTVRQQYPTLHPLYTLQVAAWSNLESNTYDPAQLRAAAERYATKLRATGFEAYVHHGEGSDISVVTIGLFTSRDIDPEATLESERLTQLREQFPYHLINGETVEEPLQGRPGRDGTIPTRTQPSMLVEVPRR